VPFLASRTIYLGYRNRIEKHRWWARITFPIWVYVSVTGVIVYFLLFVVYKPAGDV
jgi:putative membrane protein